MSNDDMMRRIKELERKVSDLEARPVWVPVPYYPQPVGPLPGYWQPYTPPWQSPWYVGVMPCTTGTQCAETNTVYLT
jgi:hypothetical protein